MRQSIFTLGFDYFDCLTHNPIPKINCFVEVFNRWIPSAFFFSLYLFPFPMFTWRVIVFADILLFQYSSSVYSILFGEKWNDWKYLLLDKRKNKETEKHKVSILDGILEWRLITKSHFIMSSFCAVKYRCRWVKSIVEEYNSQISSMFI